MIPSSPLPRDPYTCGVLATEVDAWWEGLTLGQKLSVAQPYVEANVVEVKARAQEIEIVDGEVVDSPR